MYEQFIAQWKAALPEFPSHPDLDLGMGIKQIRLRMGMTQAELAQAAGIQPAALKTLENGYARFTTMKNLEALARALKLSIRELVLECQEWASGNFFAAKLADIKKKPRLRRPKHREDAWFKQKSMTSPGYQITSTTPLFSTPSHFCFFLFQMDPGKSIRGLKLHDPEPVTGFVQRGCLRMAYEGLGEFMVLGNQGFTLRGDKLHHLINHDPDNPLHLCLAFPMDSRSHALPAFSGKTSSIFSIGRALHYIRHAYAASPRHPLTFSELARRTGIDEKALQYLENTTKPGQVIYWDKIEKIIRGLGMPLSRFLELAEGKDEGYFYHATAHDRALIDYRHFLGIRIKSALFPGPHNRLQIAEMFIDPRGGIRRTSWKRKDNARISAYVEDGDLMVEVGKNRKVNLREGESVYFDGSLGYIFTNPGNKPAKILFASFPPIVF